MLSVIESVNAAVNNFIWGVPAMICIIGVGLYLSIRTNFLQIRKFPYAIRVTIGRMLRKREASDGSLTPFQAVCTALAATVGTGNIAGVAGAQSADREQSSGCGSPHFLECVRSFPRLHSLYISAKPMPTEIWLEDQCITLRMV